MVETRIVLAPCMHSGYGISGCKACNGSGYVKVIPGMDGNPFRCMHSGYGISGCKACNGSGWAGMV